MKRTISSKNGPQPISSPRSFARQKSQEHNPNRQKIALAVMAKCQEDEVFRAATIEFAAHELAGWAIRMKRHEIGYSTIGREATRLRNKLARRAASHATFEERRQIMEDAARKAEEQWFDGYMINGQTKLRDATKADLVAAAALREHIAEGNIAAATFMRQLAKRLKDGQSVSEAMRPEEIVEIARKVGHLKNAVPMSVEEVA